MFAFGYWSFTQKQSVHFLTFFFLLMLFLFAFFFGGFPFVRRRFKFHFTSSRCTGLLRLYGQSLARFTGSGTSQSPYKCNCKNNSKLLTSRDPGIPGHLGIPGHSGTPGHPGTPGSYKQALIVHNCSIPCSDEQTLDNFTTLEDSSKRSRLNSPIEDEEDDDMDQYPSDPEFGKQADLFLSIKYI